MFEKLKLKIKELLGINKINHEIDVLIQTNNSLWSQVKILQKQNQELQRICNVGVDVHMKSNSWAVVCIEGKQDFVKFYDLGKEDAKHIKDFLKQFEYSNRRIDAPFGYIDMFKW